MNLKREEEIVKRIIIAAKEYKERIAGKTFLILYEGHSVEIMFKTENFLHLCGVDTSLYARDFYRKAISGQLSKKEIGFSNIHPYYFADIKTKHLLDFISLFERDSLIITDLTTKTRSYKLGATDLEIVLCFDTQDGLEKPSNILIPYSLRVEEIANDKYHEIYEVDYILSKRNENHSYSTLEYGNKEKLKDYIKVNKITGYSIDLDDGGGSGGASNTNSLKKDTEDNNKEENNKNEDSPIQEQTSKEINADNSKYGDKENVVIKGMRNECAEDYYGNDNYDDEYTIDMGMTM